MAAQARERRQGVSKYEMGMHERARQSAEWWDTDTAADYLHVSKKTLQRWRDSGRLEGHRAGRRWLYRPEDVRGLIR